MLKVTCYVASELSSAQNQGRRCGAEASRFSIGKDRESSLLGLASDFQQPEISVIIASLPSCTTKYADLYVATVSHIHARPRRPALAFGRSA